MVALTVLLFFLVLFTMLNNLFRFNQIRKQNPSIVGIIREPDFYISSKLFIFLVSNVIAFIFIIRGSNGYSDGFVIASCIYASMEIFYIISFVNIIKINNRVVLDAELLYKDKGLCKKLFKENIAKRIYRLENILEQSSTFSFILDIEENCIILEVDNDNVYRLYNVYGNYDTAWVVLCSLANIDYHKRDIISKVDFESSNNVKHNSPVKDIVDLNINEINRFINKINNGR